MVKRTLTIGATVSLLATTTYVLGGATLPDSYPLSEASESEANPVDANLVAWLDQHVERPSPFELDGAAFKELTAKQDPLTAAYLKVARANREASGSPGAAVRPEVDDALKQLYGDAGGRAVPSPLVPSLLNELRLTNALTPEETSKILGTFAEVGGGTCAAKEQTLDELSLANMEKLTDDGLRDLLARVNSYRSNNFKKTALRKFIGNLPEARQGAVADSLMVVAQPYPPVIKSSPWLRTLAEKAGKLAAEGPGVQLEEARQLAGKRLCSKAKDVLVLGLARVKSVKATGTLEDAVTSAKAIDGCYRARAPQLRAEFWKNVTQEMSDTYGLPGWFESKLRLGYIHWSADEFEEAKPLFAEVVAKAATDSTQRRFEARAAYALARIAENENDLPRAATFYRDYVARFPDHENFEEALMALVLIQVGLKDWPQALAPLESLIDQQGAKPLDERSTGALSFALFWAGRIHLEQGHRRDAAEMWRRVASEYYSTYYGAIGHYMLEQLVDRRLLLQPVRTPTFRMHALRDVFSPTGRERVKRVEMLMRLGLRDQAVCELEELDTDGGQPEKMLVRALMLHAAGDWLDAIKVYDALPRSFRNTLPAGFERILFPRRYDAEIRALAAKAEVDPDLVLAIIRQESVFNPLARSPVGAMGLMQLMPATARVESKRLGNAYITADEKRRVRQGLSNPLNLLVAGTNLTLGVHHVRTLLEKYESPVFVLSAYNASPSAAARWKASIPTDDVLSFIERIPYKETRAYVKLVMRNYFYYKRWYGDPKDKLKHLATLTSPLVAMVKDRAEVPEASKPAADETATP